RHTFSSAAQKVLKSVLALAIFRAPLSPFARIATVSFVDVSPSTVIALNVPATAPRNARESSDGEIATSVARKASIVAMFGWIIPAPLQHPRILTAFPPMRQFTAAHLGRVSVVIIARV